MFLNVLTTKIAGLRQPRLLKSIPQTLLDGRGVVSPKVLAGIDALLCEDAVRQILEWEMPEGLPAGTNREDRWKAVSSLQKAIRRGDVPAAMRAAHMAYDMDARYLMYRLVVCAVEDVMLGNLYAVAVTLALAGSLPNRRIGGERKTAVWLAAELAGGLKDRSACNMVLVVDFDRSLHPIMQEWGGLPDSDLSEMAADLSRPIQERMAAAWSLAGTKRFPNSNAPESHDRPRWALMALMARSGMPLILYYVADRVAGRGGGCMFASILPIWQVLQAEIDALSVMAVELPVDLGIGPFLASAYDMHTREGQAAIRRLMHEPEVGVALSAIQNPKDRLSALFEAVFFAEGGLVDRRSTTPSLTEVHHGARDVVLTYFGLTGRTPQANLMRAVHVSQDTLHRYRTS